MEPKLGKWNLKADVPDIVCVGMSVMISVN